MFDVFGFYEEVEENEDFEKIDLITWYDLCNDLLTKFNFHF